MTMLAKLTPDGAVDRYPYDLIDLMADHPATSFPPLDLLSDADLADFGAVRVHPSDPPEHDPDTQYAVELPPEVVDGVWTQVWSVVPRVISIPSEVTMRQARLALHAAGLLPLVDAAIDNLEEPHKTAARIEWEYSQEVHRDKQLVVMLAPALGLSETDLDNLFIAAAQL